MDQIKYDNIQIGNFDSHCVVTSKAPDILRSPTPYHTGVYREYLDGEGELAYQEEVNATKAEALDAHRAMLRAWQSGRTGICITCGSSDYPGDGYIVAGEHYCDDMGKDHEPLVCTECALNNPCEKHPNFCARCESPEKLCDTHRELKAEEEIWAEE